MLRKLFIGCCMLPLSACASLKQPENWNSGYYASQQISDQDRDLLSGSKRYGSTTVKSKRVKHSRKNSDRNRYTRAHYWEPHLAPCKKLPIEELDNLNPASTGYFNANDNLLAAGDIITLKIAGDSDYYSRSYTVNGSGYVILPDGVAINVSGVSILKAQQFLRETLLRNNLIQNRFNNVSMFLSEISETEIAVSGAVFQSGTVSVGSRSAEVRNMLVSRDARGDHNASRTLTQALRAAGGIRPDADLSRVTLIRDGQWISLDLSDAIDGSVFDDIQLTRGDKVIIPSLGCFQENLVRPSRFTAPGIRVFMSNLSRPALNNASSAIGKQTTSLPYGSRLSQAMVAANCVGGSAMNAGREVVLISRNPMNGQSVVVSRGVEDLVRNANRDLKDPYLMPGDALACYDSRAMNFRDVLSVVGEVASPYFLLKNLD